MTEELHVFDFRSAKPWRAVWRPFRAQRRDLIIGELFYLLKASRVWVIPIVTMNIIDAVARPREVGMKCLCPNVIVGAVMIVQNIPAGMLYGRFTSRASRGIALNGSKVTAGNLVLLSGAEPRSWSPTASAPSGWRTASSSWNRADPWNRALPRGLAARCPDRHSVLA